MKTYRNNQLGFEITLPKEWHSLNSEAIVGPFGDGMVFKCNTMENFNILVGHSFSESLEQIKREFSRYAIGRKYTELEFSEIEVGNKNHVCASYRMGTGDWAKKYLIVFDKTEYDMTASCLSKKVLKEREKDWDKIVKSFKVIPSEKQPLSTNLMERAIQAQHRFDQGNKYFQAGKYYQALEKFEEGKLISHEFPWNFLGASMTLMQMVETKTIPDDLYSLAVAFAEKNIHACILISPREQDYHHALKVIQDYKNKYPLSD